VTETFGLTFCNSAFATAAMRTNPGLPNEPSEIPTDFTSFPTNEPQKLNARTQLRKLFIIIFNLWILCFSAAARSRSASGGTQNIIRRCPRERTGQERICAQQYDRRKAVAQAPFFRKKTLGRRLQQSERDRRRRLQSAAGHNPWAEALSFAPQELQNSAQGF